MTDLKESKKIPVIEYFGPTVQGEGALTGQISYFLRTGVCPYRCTWCDSMHAVDPKQIKKHATYMTQEEILKHLQGLYEHGAVKQWVTLSGGDPLMWDLTKVVHGLRLDEMKVAVETQGSFCPEWLDYVDLITCSPKPPSSGMSEKVSYDIISEYQSKYAKRLILKVVIFDRHDLEFAESIKEAYPHIPFYLSLGTPTYPLLKGSDLNIDLIRRYRWLADQFLKRPRLHGATISPQMHTLLFGRAKGK